MVALGRIVGIVTVDIGAIVTAVITGKAVEHGGVNVDFEAWAGVTVNGKKFHIRAGLDYMVKYKTLMRLWSLRNVISEMIFCVIIRFGIS